MTRAVELTHRPAETLRSAALLFPPPTSFGPGSYLRVRRHIGAVLVFERVRYEGERNGCVYQ